MINIRNTIRISNKKTSLDGGFFLPSRLVSFYSGYFLLFQLFRFLIFSVHFYRFEMDSHMGICTEVLLQFCFYMSSMLMCLIKRKRTRHADVHLYRNLVSDATGTQVMNLSHSLFFICYDAIKDRMRENWSLDLEKYNADKEYFPITCNFNEIRATIYVSVPIAEAPQFQKDFNKHGGFQTAEPLRRFGKFVYVQNMICPTSILVNRKPYWIWRGGNREGYYGEINDDFFIDADTAKVTYKDAKPLVVKFNDLGIKNKYLTNYVYVFKKEEHVKSIMMPIDGNSELVDTDKIYEQVEEMPSFPGGSNALLSFIAANLKYPVVAQENGIQGRVIVKFVVDKDGRITDVEITRSVDPSLDKEAMRIVKAMPKWKPGKLKGNCVRVKYTIPIVFGLS
jgi:TonB family protein